MGNKLLSMLPVTKSCCFVAFFRKIGRRALPVILICLNTWFYVNKVFWTRLFTSSNTAPKHFQAVLLATLKRSNNNVIIMIQFISSWRLQ